MQAVVQAWDGEAAQLFPRLFADYWERFSDLQSFFPYNPWDGESYARRAAWLDQAFTGDRGALAADLRDYQHQLDADAAALQQVALLAQPGTLVVVTGQQAGLLGGPLFTLYKAVTAIRLARELGEQLGRPVVPVFWIASDDHDFDEVRRAYLRDRRGRLRELALPGQRGRRPVGELPPPRRWLSLLREVEQALGERLHHRPVLERAEHIPADANWADAFGRLLAGLLSRYGLVILNPMRRPLRALLRDFFPLALLRKDSIHRELAAAATRLERRGYPPALAFDVEHSHLFLLEDGERVALQFQDGELVDRDGRVRLSLASALRLMDEEPWRFSPNVVLRPLAQDKLLPTLAYVAGPGEVGYLAQ
ncbi:MAG TPA: bacillithiol biosynthesis cysteine-adding enzyme BshC, partial [Bacillota bacterium]